MKIAVYAICKNEEKFVRRWLHSMQEADGIFVTDTGSEDNTVALLKAGNAAVQTVSITPWRFDTARNRSLDFVPEDYDICVCTDLDEVFTPGWRSALEAAWREGETTRARYLYIWSFSEDGTPDVRFYSDKIHSRFGYRWAHPVHEVLKRTDASPEAAVTCGGMELRHYPDKTKSRAQYLPLLELSVREAPGDDRNMHYLGREYLFYGRWDDCIRTLKRHLAMKTATWADERAASMRYIARAYQAKGETETAMQWLLRAVAEAPYLREGYAETALLALQSGDFATAYHMAKAALRLPAQSFTYLSEPFARDVSLYDIASVAAFRLGQKEKALVLIEKALSLSPGDERIRSDYEAMKG